MPDGIEATVYANGAMKTQAVTVDHVLDDHGKLGGPIAYGRIWIDHHLSIELSPKNVERLIEALSELDLS